MSKMEMTQREVMELVKEFAEIAGYTRVIIKNIKPDESSKKWTVEIIGDEEWGAPSVTKTFVVDDNKQEVSFQEPAKHKYVPYKVSSEKK